MTKISKPLRINEQHLARFKGGISARGIQILTGWSKATVYRKIATTDFPEAQKKENGEVLWITTEVLDWVSRYNLRVLMGPEKSLQFERDMSDRSFVDSSLRPTLGRVIEREIQRRKIISRSGVEM